MFGNNMMRGGGNGGPQNFRGQGNNRGRGRGNMGNANFQRPQGQNFQPPNFQGPQRPSFQGPPGPNFQGSQGPPNPRMQGFQGPQGPAPMMQGFGGGASGPPRFPMNGPGQGPPMGNGFQQDFHPMHNEFQGPGPKPNILTPEAVMSWLDEQHPMVVQQVMYHCNHVLEQNGLSSDNPPGFGGPGNQSGDMSGWYDASARGMKRPGLGNRGGPDPKRGRGGFVPNKGQGNLQWTPSGWVQKDNSHKITTTMKPLPEPEIIPPSGSANYPEAAADRDKLKMLSNNINMMNFELTKICKNFKINNFKKENLNAYSEEAQTRLKTPLTCLEKAEQTLAEFKEYLKTEKYKEYNEKQNEKIEDEVKSMIGTMPSGIPHKWRQDSGSDIKAVIGDMPKGQPHSGAKKDEK